MLYETYQVHDDFVAPLRRAARWAGGLGDRMGWLRSTGGRHAVAAWELISRLELTHQRPAFGIATVRVGNRDAVVAEELVLDLPFGRLLRFAKDVDAPQPKILVVAPLSGHFATLLRGTIATLLRDHDVYVTDWANARDVPADGRAVRRRRLCRLPDPLPRGDRPGRAPARGLPALRAGAGGGGGDVGGRQPGDAAVDDADGRPDRHPRKPDRGQRTGAVQAPALVRALGDRTRAAALQGRRPPGLSRLRAADAPSWR